MNTTREDYLAGYFDGRGCFDIHPYFKGSKTYWNFRIKVADTKESLLKLKSLIGFGIMTTDNRQLWITSREQVKILVKILERGMVIRREKLIEFKNSMMSYEREMQRRE